MKFWFFAAALVAIALLLCGCATQQEGGSGNPGGQIEKREIERNECLGIGGREIDSATQCANDEIDLGAISENTAYSCCAKRGALENSSFFNRTGNEGMPPRFGNMGGNQSQRRNGTTPPFGNGSGGRPDWNGTRGFGRGVPNPMEN